MDNDDFIKMGNKNCSSLNIVLKNEGTFGGPYSTKFDYNYNDNILRIEIEQCLVRTINLSATSPITMSQICSFYTILAQLLMIFDGRFYNVKCITFDGDDCSEEEYAIYADECRSRMLPCYKTDPAYCRNGHIFLKCDTMLPMLSPELISKWIELRDELDIVHQVALYNIADTGMTHDAKCANFIECLEPMAEIIGVYDKSFTKLKPGDRKTTLKMCIDAVISKYGKDIFAVEYSVDKDKFLQILVNTRNRIMHIKRNQQTGKYLSGEESLLYLIKLCHLYRVVLLSLLDIDYTQYQSVVMDSVNQWNRWHEILKEFKNKLELK